MRSQIMYWVCTTFSRMLDTLRYSLLAAAISTDTARGLSRLKWNTWADFVTDCLLCALRNTKGIADSLDVDIRSICWCTVPRN